MMDDTDAAIVEILQANARVSQADIARTVGLAPSAVLERIRKLEGRGIVTGYTALISPAAVDRRLLAFVSVRTTDRPGEARVGQALADLPEVLEVHHVAGDDCLLLKIRVREATHLSQILRERLGPIEGISSTRTTIVLETVKETPRIPLPPGDPSPGGAS
jgi:Lrp/AsnC family leucine-responsive transcriptional regulator